MPLVRFFQSYRGAVYYCFGGIPNFEPTLGPSVGLYSPFLNFSIASLSGIDCAIVVTEPTLSGLHDAKRVIEVANHFKIPVKMVINKHNLNSEMTEKIEEYCHVNSIPLLAKIEFDKTVVDAMVAGKTIVEYSDGKTKQMIEKMWNAIKEKLQ